MYINGKVVSFIIEDKTHTSHHSDQLRKYRDGISKDKDAEDEIFCIYFKTGYMFPDEKKEVEDNGYSIFDYKKMNEFLQNYTTDNLIFDSYKEYIKEKYFDLYEQNKNRWKDGYYSCFEYGFAQCEYLLNLSEKCKETIPPGKVHIYGGSNRSGSSWTQLKFIEIADVYCEEVNEYVFYRLDKRDSKYYLSVRQYANIKDKNSEEAINLKLERLDRYQEIFKQAINKGNLKFRDKLSNRGVNESEIAVLFFDENENTPNNVLEEMKSIHAAFVEGIKNRQLGTITPSIKR